MKKHYLFLSMAALLVAPSVMAADYPTTCYDAQYKVVNPQGNSDLRMASDGKGHFLTTSSMSGFKSTSIIDYKTRTSTTLIEQGKMAMQTKLPKDGGYVADDETAKKQGGKPLGNKVVAGHPCHGFEYKTPSGTTETWIGDDCHIMVKSTTTSPAGKVVMELKSVGGAPSADAFKVPEGYKLMSQ